ncbi:uncharacterized protein LOC119108164 [Pollicipes pollicipes]|uniref:uncharacterized protein LOC119108164 n=1 Tax=Pollicipes pollicipes TaxID=41117 RepID=UPI0018850D0C|nr:uncharacterized protein LOC119108164 [Pollicipes pollicipes]
MVNIPPGGSDEDEGDDENLDTAHVVDIPGEVEVNYQEPLESCTLCSTTRCVKRDVAICFRRFAKYHQRRVGVQAPGGGSHRHRGVTGRDGSVTHRQRHRRFAEAATMAAMGSSEEPLSDDALCRLGLPRADGQDCDDVINPRVSQEALTHSFSAPSHVLMMQRQAGSLDAVLYVSIVVVFYVAIILVLIGANLYRRRHSGCTDRRPLLIYDEKSAAVDQHLLTCEQEPGGECV